MSDIGIIQSTYVTCFLTLFLCWTAQEIMERKFGMSPAIRRTTSLHDDAAVSDNPKRKHDMVRRLTKQLDHKGRFRIQTRGTIYYIKGVWNIATWAFSFSALMWEHDWFLDHFWKLDANTVVYYPLSHTAASILAFYAWEMSANRYAKLNYSIIIHHWLTSLAALGVLLGNFNPFATWYGWTAVQSVFPIWFILGLRATFSQQYPTLTRHGFVFAFWWYLFVICVNMSGQVFLIVNGLVTGRIPIWNIILILFAILGWMADDVQLLRSLYDFSTHNYEDADLFARKRTARELGGRSLFAKSILMDVEGLEKSRSGSRNGNNSPDFKSPSGRHLSPKPMPDSDSEATGDETERVQMKPMKTQNNVVDTDVSHVSSKVSHDLQVRLSPKHKDKGKVSRQGTAQSAKSTHTHTESVDVELIKRAGSLESKDFKILAKYNQAGTFHSTTEREPDSAPEDPILPNGPSMDHSNFVPVFAANESDLLPVAKGVNSNVSNASIASIGSNAAGTVGLAEVPEMNKGEMGAHTVSELGLHSLSKQDTTSKSKSRGSNRKGSVENKSGNVNSLHGKGNYNAAVDSGTGSSSPVTPVTKDKGDEAEMVRWMSGRG